MEQELNLPYDRALSEAVWRRVAPELTPFAPLPADYLMTGKFYQPPAAAGQEPPLPWCQLLRELYHEEACGGAAYAQAAEDTEDVCLRELFQRLSRAEYGHAAMLLHVLENSLTSGNNLLK